MFTGLPGDFRRRNFSAGLKQRVQSHRRVRDIQGTRLFDDFETYAENVKNSLIRNDAQRELNAGTRRLRLEEKLAKLELTRNEWEAVRQGAHKDDHLYAKSFAFYLNAEAREQAMFEHLLKFVSRDHKSRPTPSAKGG